MADSGIVSSITELFFLASISGTMEFFFSSAAPSSSRLKLVLRFAKLASPVLLSLFNCRPICPLFSTVTKLVRIFESGRGEVPLLLSPADL